MIKYITLIGFLVFAAWFDLKTRKVSNELILLGLGFGLFFQLQEHEILGLGYFLRDAIYPIVVLYLLFLLHGLGAGDIKVFALISSFLGIRIVSKCMIISIFIGGIFSIIKIIKNRKDYKMLNAIQVAKGIYYSNFDTDIILQMLQFKNRDESNTICFTVPILLSCLICIWEVIF